jgi:SAM-dependent methyltransferase
MTRTEAQPEPGSFRDREGRVFYREGRIYRALSARALADWQALEGTSFFETASRRGHIVPTRPADLPPEKLTQSTGNWVAVLEHKRLPFISYPYEWCFGMLRDAALLHLDLMLASLEEDLILKDSSAYNIQWLGAHPQHIDTPSFQRWRPGEAWVGYRQFCQLFLYPLMLTAYRQLPFQPWLRGSIDGITPEDCNNLLTGRDRLRGGVFTHVYLQSKLLAAASKPSSSLRQELKAAGLGKQIITRNVRSLRKLITRLQWKRSSSEWSSYADKHSYSEEDEKIKRDFVERAVATRSWGLVWDLGCNTGAYSRIAAENSSFVVAMDGDSLAVERLYRELKIEGNRKILPLVVNLADPSPNLGWDGKERRSLAARADVDLTLCLALVHHMVISANVPLAEFIDWLARLRSHLVIEFVTRDDAMVQRLLLNKDDIYHDYNLANFEKEIGRRFTTLALEELHNGTRVLYFLRPR